MTATFETLKAIDQTLAEKGHHPLTPFWSRELERFYSHPTADTYVARVGRGGAKSHTAVKVSLNETLVGDWNVPPGERHFWAFISLSKDEAAQRLVLIERFLSDLGIGYSRKGDEIHLDDMPRGWRVMACQVGAVSGFRCFGCSLDECAKWSSGTDKANPAAEVAASVGAMMVTHPGAKQLMISSPLGLIDFHNERFELGDTENQITIHAPSWVANPQGITEEQTRKIEPHEATWLREYAAIPSDRIENYFGGAIDHAIDQTPQRVHQDVRYYIGIDQAFQHDRFGYAVCSSERGPVDEYGNRPIPRVTRIHEVGAWKPDRSPREMARRLLKEVCLRYHTNHAYADQYSGLAFKELANDVGLKLEIVPWTSTGDESKSERFKAVRLAMFEGTFKVPDDDALKQELRSVRTTVLTSGVERVTIPRTAMGHGDRVSALVLAGSVALSRPPQLAPSKMTGWELREERMNRQALAMLF